MLNKRIKALLFIFLILFCISVVNGEDSDINSIDIENVNDVIAIEESDFGTFSDLNNAINGGENASKDTINLDRNYTYNNDSDKAYTKGITINRTLTVDGHGHTIDGNHSARIFNVTNGTLTIKNINLVNGYVYPAFNDYNGGRGGAIYSLGNITVINSTFSNNSIKGHNGNDGGAIYTAGNLTVDNSTFINNSAGAGGAISSDGNMTVNNSKFINNTVNLGKIYSTGGAINSNGNIVIKNSFFTNNTIPSGMDSWGGAIYSDKNITLINSTVMNSMLWAQHSGDGGAIHSRFGDILIINSTIHNNTVTGNSYHWGGAIYAYGGNVYIINSTISENNALDSRAGAIECLNTVVVINSTFIKNNASAIGGIYSHNIIIINSNFTENFNGAVSGIDVTVINSIFANNTGSGSALSSNSLIYMNNSIFTNNVGGAVSCRDGNITDSLFVNNTSEFEGGAIITDGNLNITDSNFTNNSGSYGGAIYYDWFENLTINNCNFIQNIAKINGGAIYCGNIQFGILKIINSNFIRNTANCSGGAVVGEVVNIIKSTFTNNTAAENGGAICACIGNITESVFTNNNAANGGAIVIAVGNVTINSAKFISNNATNGGAIYFTNIYSNIIDCMKIYFPEYYQDFLDDPEDFDKYIDEYIEYFLYELEDVEYEIGNLSEVSTSIVNSLFEGNSGKLGDDIFTAYNTTVSGNKYTENSYANIYANNTVVNCTVVSVLGNMTVYVNYGSGFKLNATVLADGASVNGYNLTITDGTNKYNAGYKGYGIYEIIDELIADFTVKHYTATINNITDHLNYIVENGTVVGYKKNITIEVELDPAVAGGNITGNITLKDENGEIANITGEVNVEIDGQNYTVNITEGKGSFNIEDEFGPGNYTMNVMFNETENYNPANTTVDFTIIDDGIILEVNNLTKYYGNTSGLIIILTDMQGNPIANQLITITINGVTYNRTTDSEGRILMGINLIPGIYETVVSYGNITKNITVTIISTVESEDLIKYFKNGTHYYAKFYNVDGTPLANSEVIFNIHGVFYKRTTDENGIAKLNINLNPGEYIITAINPVNNETKSNNISVLSTIFGNNVVKYYRNGTQYYAKVYDLDGSPLKNQNVTFNIHGVFYNRTTDENGLVKLNINLNPGEYIITAWNLVNNESKSNNITVFTVVESKDLEMTTDNRKAFKVTILGDHGAPLANAQVSFNIHGVFYYKTTDANGEVSLDINLIAGKYIITTYYNDYSISNTIIVK